MKRIAIIFCSIFCATVIFAQSMNVNIGEVTYVHKAANTGEMLFSNGTTNQ